MKTAAPVRQSVFPLLLVFCLTFGLAVGIGLRYYIMQHTSLASGVIDPRGAFPGKSRINILVMGIDDNWTRKDMVYTTGARTDTIFVASLDLNTRKVYMLSIPRDFRVRVSGTRHWGKINGAYATGGWKRAVQTVSDFLGVPIDKYIVLRINATKELVNSIGGVDLNVDEDMNYDDHWGHLSIHLKKGMQHLDGDQAVGYIRFRHDAAGDFGRIQRQQQLLHTIVNKLKSPVMWLQLPKIEATFKSSVDTDLDDGQIAALAVMFRGISPSQIVSAYIPGKNDRIGGVWYLLPDEVRKAQLVDWLLKGSKDAEIPLVKVLVEDGCGDRIATLRVKNELSKLGFDASVGPAADGNNYATTQVIDYGRMKGAGELVVQKLQLSSPPVVRPDPESASAVELIVGQDLADSIKQQQPLGQGGD